MLELTRAHDWRQEWFEITDDAKTLRYKRMQERVLNLLPQGWEVETIPLTVGIRGSIHKPNWPKILDRFGISARKDQEQFLLEITRQMLEELDRMYGVRSEALR